MSQRAFIVLFVLLATVVGLSATAFPGSMIGFLFAIGAVYFAAMPGDAVAGALARAGIPITGRELVWLAAGLYALLVLVAVMQTWRLLRRRALDEARSAGLRLALLLALPLAGWLSTNSMMRAWP